MLVYRVFPWIPGARVGKAGHPLHLHPDQGAGRWDNPDLYLTFYCSAGAEATVGETFAHLTHWSMDMLAFPQLPGATRALGVYQFDEEAFPVLDFDDAKALLDRDLRPTEIVIRNRPHTQAIARRVYGEGAWAGIRWWSVHRPQWSLLALFGVEAVRLASVEPLPGHPAITAAAATLAKMTAPDLAG